MPLDAQAVADAAQACPDVARLSGGVFGEVATYLPGGRIVGVRDNGVAVEVRIVARWGRSLPEIGEQVRHAIQPLVGTASILIFVDEIDAPDRSDSHRA